MESIYIVGACKTSQQKWRIGRTGTSQSNTPCVFPFTLLDVTYFSCAYGFISSKFFDYLPWCSTKVDKNGKHVAFSDGSFNVGVCEPKSKCPIPPKRKFLGG